MRIYDLIKKKKDGRELTKDEINFMVNGYAKGEIPDYQMSAMLMAICFQGMSKEETGNLTIAMSNSGDIVDLSSIKGIKVDKHSTGGVGDKTTLVIAPIVAACGVKVAKMSGRGLGHTGGTIDKLEAIPNFRVELKNDEFFNIVNNIGVAVVGQSGNLAPADKKIYALRDVTATVDSIPLIASSIMSKKLASGSDKILLDVKTGSGAFMETLDDSIELAKTMVAIGEHGGKNTIALITDMDIPLGNAIGNSLEVIESIDVLKGIGPKDLTIVCEELAANMLYLGDIGTIEECYDKVREVIINGEALDVLVKMVEAQGGESSYIKDSDKFLKAAYSFKVISDKDGYVEHMDTQACGIASMLLGAGRETSDSVLDYSAGIILNKKTGDYVSKGDVLGTLYASGEELFKESAKVFLNAYSISSSKPEERSLILAKVDIDKVKVY